MSVACMKHTAMTYCKACGQRQAAGTHRAAHGTCRVFRQASNRCATLPHGSRQHSAARKWRRCCRAVAVSVRACRTSWVLQESKGRCVCQHVSADCLHSSCSIQQHCTASKQHRAPRSSAGWRQRQPGPQCSRRGVQGPAPWQSRTAQSGLCQGRCRPCRRTWRSLGSRSTAAQPPHQ